MIFTMTNFQEKQNSEEIQNCAMVAFLYQVVIKNNVKLEFCKLKHCIIWDYMETQV